MRISINPADPGHEKFVALGGNNCKVTVLLNGQPVDDAITADEDLGIVIVTARDERGMIFAAGDEIATKTLTGLVEVTVEKRRD